MENLTPEKLAIIVALVLISASAMFASLFWREILQFFQALLHRYIAVSWDSAIEHIADNNRSSFDNKKASGTNKIDLVSIDTDAVEPVIEPATEPVPELVPTDAQLDRIPSNREIAAAALATVRNDVGEYMFSRNEIVAKLGGNRAETLKLISKYRPQETAPVGKHNFTRAELDAA